MSWTPIFDVSTGDKSASETDKETTELEFRTALLSILDSIHKKLCLIDARIEEANETGIEEADL